MQFPEFEPTGQPAGDVYLARCAAILAPMSQRARYAWLIDTIDAIRDRPVTPAVNAFTKSAIILTLDRWLERIVVREAA